MKNYDVIIIGAGPGGIFSAFELIKLDPTLKVGVFEAGHALEKRKCPIDGDKIKTCINCKSCSIMSGFGGAGAYSDGKFNITSEFGGWMTDYLPEEEVIDLIKYVDAINLKHGAPEEILYNAKPHIGTDKLKITIKNIRNKE